MKDRIVYIFRYLFWALSRLFVVLYIRPKFNLVLDRKADPIPKPPFIMVSNHGTFFDPWIVGHYSRYPLSIMMNDDGYKTNPLVQWYLRSIGTFPKKKGASDYRAMKTTLKMIDKGYPILIFPEGQTSWNGETQPIFPGIEKIIKKTKCHLVMMNVKGNFLSKPWWSESFRKGRVRIFRKVLYTDELSNLSEAQLLQTILSYIYQNDIKDQGNIGEQFRGHDLALGLERFIWMCGFCKSEDTLYTEGNRISCTACNNSLIMDPHCRLKIDTSQSGSSGLTIEFKDLYEWEKWHKQNVKEKIAKNEKNKCLAISTEVNYCTLNDNGSLTNLAHGTLSLDKETLRFHHDGEEHGEPLLNLAVKSIKEYVIQRKDIFSFQSEGKMYQFSFHKHSAMKWVCYFQYLNDFADSEKRGYL